jgi:hypothetical protein
MPPRRRYRRLPSVTAETCCCRCHYDETGRTATARRTCPVQAAAACDNCRPFHALALLDTTPANHSRRGVVEVRRTPDDEDDG